uniref:C2H2-type domain-containing protein n=1 Tax=Anabas testudineus TaxID=64144 RepID=A0A3Q1HH97_ANATE
MCKPLENCRAAEEQREPTQTSEEDLKHSEEKTSTTLYRCHICNYIFTKKTVLTWHLKTHESKSHDGKGNFDCHVCGKHIPCQSNLQNHMRVHTGERPYSCHFCGKCFKLKGHMTEHIRTHTGEKPFSCHICDKSFNRGSTLRKHVLAKHKEERPYKCRDCEELFTERLLMKRHMRKIHGIKLSTNHSIPPQHDQLLPSFGASLYTKKKTMFFCNICCQAFVEKAELKLHLAAHATNSLPKPTNKEFTCFVCGRITDTRSQMICHMRTHTGEKPFSCPVCGNRYKLKSHMKEHMRTHTGERPYSCYICGRSFNRSSTMSKHARIQHREGMPFKCVQCSQRHLSLSLHETLNFKTISLK